MNWTRNFDFISWRECLFQVSDHWRFIRKYSSFIYLLFRVWILLSYIFLAQLWAKYNYGRAISRRVYIVLDRVDIATGGPYLSSPRVRIVGLFRLFTPSYNKQSWLLWKYLDVGTYSQNVFHIIPWKRLKKLFPSIYIQLFYLSYYNFDRWFQ